MKNALKKTLCVVLCLTMLYGALQITVAAGEQEENVLRLLTYNVSGIPLMGTFQGTAKSSGNQKSAGIGALLNGLDVDIIGVQEDFNYHKGLAENMPAFPYQTVTSGGIPAGDGLNFFAKKPLYNVTRTAWESTYGVLSGSTDRLAQKGFIYTVAEIAEGVYIDLYVLHADAGVDFKSVEARADNFRQMARHINARTQDRAVVAIGDFNFMYARCLVDDLYGNLIKPTGLKDLWIELRNDGRYEYGDGAGWNPTLWDSLDRILYKNGGGVEFTPQAFEYLTLTDENGKTHTDHIAISGALSYKIVNPPQNAEELTTEAPMDPWVMFWKQFKATVKMLFLVVFSLPELFYLFDQLLIEKLGWADGIFYS